MKNFFKIFALLLLATPLFAEEKSSPLANDELILKTGEKVIGRILAQTSKEVIMLLDERHTSISREQIDRIYDRPDGHIANTVILPKPGKFPPWWVAAYDLFYLDWVKSFRQVPATVIEEGFLQNVPYLSFRANRNYELNIYGDPDSPAAIEIGVYGFARSSKEAHQFAREFISSYLHSVKEIRALDQLPSTGGQTTVDGMSMQITPPDAPDAYGAWWITIWYPKSLEAARIAPEDLDRHTDKYYETVSEAFGSNKWSKREMAKVERKLSRKSEKLVFVNE